MLVANCLETCGIPPENYCVEKIYEETPGWCKSQAVMVKMHLIEIRKQPHAILDMEMTDEFLRDLLFAIATETS